MEQRYFSAAEAAEELGIAVGTLYSYVSRGLIRSEETEGPSRAKQYRAEDVLRLKQRQAVRRDPAQAAPQALRYGDPVLESALTLITEEQLFYRGYSVEKLVRERSFEEVAALLWTGDFAAVALFAAAGYSAPSAELPATLPGLQAALALASAGDLAAFTLTPTAVAQVGARIVRCLVAVATALPPGELAGLSVAGALQRAWVPQHFQVTSLLDTALILCADHELNVSAFTARCVASAGATPYQVVIAGLAALSGFRHGGYTERVEVLFREAKRDVHGALAGYGRRGEEVPGFHHPLYPTGDPRARLLLELVERYDASKGAPASMFATARALRQAMLDSFGQHPTIDFALVALAHALGLPAGSALLLFALGRTAGWLAHAIEQYQSEVLIRPRARYVGVEV